MAYAVLFYMVGRHPDRRVRAGSLIVASAGSVVAGIMMPYTYPNAMERGGNQVWAVVIATIGAAVVGALGAQSLIGSVTSGFQVGLPVPALAAIVAGNRGAVA